MLLLDLREPINAWSHGTGMVLALPVTWVLWKRCTEQSNYSNQRQGCGSTLYQRVKALCLLVFGVSLMMCYGTSAVFHAVRLSGEPLGWLQRLDHVGIYLLIAGTYTPVAWSLMRGSWWWGTMTTVWTVALVCAARVWCGGVLPMWVSTLTYLTMGWGALFCYFELARTYSHWTLLPLPLGGVFYSVGALLNLARWPVLFPGVFAAHELFHLLVIAGSACHIFFMIAVVIPSPEPATLPQHTNSPRAILEPDGASIPQRGSLRQPHFAGRTLLKDVLTDRAGIDAVDKLDLDAVPPDKVVEMA
jgi:hemolysin III